MKYLLSAFRHAKHPDGYVVADKIPMESIEDAMTWIYTNMFRARTDTAEVRFETLADREGITEMMAEYEGEWSLQEFDQLNGIECVVIQRADKAQISDLTAK